MRYLETWYNPGQQPELQDKEQFSQRWPVVR
jgi:hypothetical protein